MRLVRYLSDRNTGLEDLHPLQKAPHDGFDVTLSDLHLAPLFQIPIVGGG